MNFWLEFLPIVIYILLIIILLVGIILGLRFIVLLGKAQRVMDDIKEKMRSLDGLFHIIDTATDKVVLVTDKVVDAIMGFIAKIFIKDDEPKVISGKKKEGKRK